MTKITTRGIWNIANMGWLIIALFIEKEYRYQCLMIGILCCIAGSVHEIAENTRKDKE